MPTLISYLKDMSVVSPRSGLEKEILQAVLAVRNQDLKRRRRVAYAGIVSSLGIFVFTCFVFGKTLLLSDFWSVPALLFSDVVVALRYGNDFLFSLLETFPAFSLFSVLFPLFIFLLFFNMYVGILKKQYSFNE